MALVTRWSARELSITHYRNQEILFLGCHTLEVRIQIRIRIQCGLLHTNFLLKTYDSQFERTNENYTDTRSLHCRA